MKLHEKETKMKSKEIKQLLRKYMEIDYDIWEEGGLVVKVGICDQDATFIVPTHKSTNYTITKGHIVVFSPRVIEAPENKDWAKIREWLKS